MAALTNTAIDGQNINTAERIAALFATACASSKRWPATVYRFPDDSLVLVTNEHDGFHFQAAIDPEPVAEENGPHIR